MIDRFRGLYFAIAHLFYRWRDHRLERSGWDNVITAQLAAFKALEAFEHRYGPEPVDPRHHYSAMGNAVAYAVITFLEHQKNSRHVIAEIERLWPSARPKPKAKTS